MTDKEHQASQSDRSSALREVAQLADLSTIAAPRADGGLTPLALYLPKDSASPPPLALLSHGVGGSESNLRYLATALRDSGWLAAVMGHRESGRSVLREQIRRSGLRNALLELTTSPEAHRARLLDIGAALDWIERRCLVSRRALLGHSMGAATVMIEAGAQNLVEAAGADRFDGYVAMSPQGPGSIFPQHAWNGIAKPVLLLTGTRDTALEGDWHWRTIPYDDLPPGRKWLAVVTGAPHMSFSGIGFRFGVRALTVRVVGAFLAGLSTGTAPAPPSARRISLRVG